MVPKTQNKGAGTVPQEARCVRKVPTHIAGLDEVLRGGLPAGRTSLVSGGPGSGKSILGLGFLCRSAMAGEPGIFVTFEERAAAVRQNAATMGWDLASLEADGKLYVMEAIVDPHVVRSGDFSIKALLAIIEGQANAMGANRIVIDAIDVLLRLFDDPKRELDELYALHEWLIDHGLTTLMTVKTPQVREHAGQYEFLDFMVDCVIEINSRVVEQIATRRIRIVKCRGSGFGRNEYPFVITGDGLHVIPITEAGLQHQALGRYISSGHSRLDVLLDGGYRTASAIMFTGASGTGISSLVDTIVALRHVEVGGEVNRTLLVAKSRGSNHSNQYREFLITDQGIDLVDVYVGGGGVLTGVARQEQEARERGAQVLRQQEIEGKVQEVGRLRAISQTEAVRQDTVIAAAEAELEGLRLAQTVIEDGDGVRRQRRGDDGKSDRQQAAPRPRGRRRGGHAGRAK